MTATTLFPPDACHDIRFGLYEPTMEFADADWGAEVFAPWAARHRPILAALHEAGRPSWAARALAAEDRWALYALSRLADVLLLPAQPPPPVTPPAAGPTGPRPAGPSATPAQSPPAGPADPDDWLPRPAYRQFLAGIGGAAPVVDGFHPFFHEIVAVEPADDPAAPPEVVASWWPGCQVGSLLLVRAGVTVRAGADVLDPVVAATSALYWASRRRYRPACDLSHGWGRNSLWRTAFRRDYRLPGRLLYNVDAALQPAAAGPESNHDLDLLRYRCSTLTDLGDDEWVWDTHHAEPA